jgi:ferrochelatase
MSIDYDALVLVSFGGPERADDVLPFLENVLRGKNVPRARMLEVAEHYYDLGGVSPINAQNRALITALVHELNTHGTNVAVYWGNRNWHPLLTDAVQQMADDGIRRALAFVTSAYSSYSGCRQYLEDIERARQQVGTSAPTIDKLRAFYNHPGFIEPVVENVEAAIREVPEPRRTGAELLMVAHSIPIAMSATCEYVQQLQEVGRLVAEGAGVRKWRLVYQSRSGPPSQPWLEPDICDVLAELGESKQTTDIVIAPIGFVSDHMEVVYDLDTEAQAVCEQLGLNMVRAATVGTHPRFVRMIRELIEERLSDNPSRLALGTRGPSHDVCPVDCCRYTPSLPG